MIFLEENLNIQSIKNSLLHSLNSTIFHGTRKLLHEAPLLFLLIKLRVSGRTSVSEVLDSAIRNWASASRQSLIIIIHKTLGPGSGQAWYRTQERCDAKQEGLQLPPCSSPPLSLSLSLFLFTHRNHGFLRWEGGAFTSQSSRNPITSGVCAH